MAGKQQSTKTMKACLTGCAVLFLLGVLGMGVLVVYFKTSAQATLETANSFVDTAMAGTDTEAYGMLHPLQREKTSPELFAKHWKAARNVVGEGPQATATGQPTANFESSLVTFQYQVIGSSGTVMVEVDVNPGEKPPTVVNYRITGVPAEQPVTGEPAEPTREVAPAKSEAEAEAGDGG